MLKGFKRDASRTLFFVLVTAFALLWLGNGLDDKSYQVVFFSTGVVLLLAWLSHVTRRVQFYRLDLPEIVIEAMKNPMGASVVFASIVYFLTVLVQAGVGMMR